ncbi:Outer membrane protein A precursor [Fulvivirga imtechensis AK7]|uniref:Outer membrane protein A n=2 Tax=Fulvivirga TaxID=396811 RepID=L8JQB6_9BACT|nr:Outer membrane protein A precursor [Fulvivirga imtechensis AK7]
MPYYKHLFALLLVFFQLPVAGQQVDTAMAARELVNDILLGNGVAVGNVKFKGAKYAIGIYEDSLNEIGMTKGIVLTSGSVLLIKGPNKSPRTGWASNAPGDDDLNAIARGETYDASVLEFDFVTASENLVFEYVFASEEYLEYVGSKFNDVFGFFIEGPGLPKTNIARLPDGRTPITVNTVNNEQNSEYYRDNTYVNTTDPFVWDVRNRKVVQNKYYLKEEIPPKYNIQFDGFTTVLEARWKVIPNQVYHIKLAIADVGDGILDSGVILKGGSFRSYGEQQVDISAHFKEVPEPQTAITKKALIPTSTGIRTRGIPREMKIGNIEFDFDKYDIPPKASDVLTQVIDQYHQNPKSTILITGHTDNWGSDDYNENLSKNRSDAVATALQALGIPQERLVIQYKGERLPLLPNDTSTGRARNRRVELIVAY